MLETTTEIECWKLFFSVSEGSGAIMGFFLGQQIGKLSFTQFYCL